MAKPSVETANSTHIVDQVVTSDLDEFEQIKESLCHGNSENSLRINHRRKNAAPWSLVSGLFAARKGAFDASEEVQKDENSWKEGK